MTTLNLTRDWQLVKAEAGQFASPAEVDWSDSLTAEVPGTVASALSSTATNCDDIDAWDWWYSTRFGRPEAGDDLWIDFEGLATFADIWLNGEKLESSDNMFRRYLLNVRSDSRKDNHLVIAFRSVSHQLSLRRPRPRWKTQLVDNQQLRWIRTSLLGRIPGWTPPTPAIGPWRPIRVYDGASLVVARDLSWTSVTDGKAQLNIDLSLVGGDPERDTELEVGVLDRTFTLPIEWRDGIGTTRAQLELDSVPLWRPHTQGPVERVALSFRRPGQADALSERMICFREVRADRADDGFKLRVNGTSVFCRGGCWTVSDITSFNGDKDRMRATLQAAADAGLNMVRVGGTMTYESDAFYDICDELGILVWQDFMFASMDYPADDSDFLDSVKQEITEQVSRLRSFGCVAVFCGSSETEQQAAMFGKDRETWEHPLFREHIPAWLKSMEVTQPYVPSSPCDGPLPMHNAVGISHYFGVGAYLQDFTDLDRSRVRFASECLAFANVPAERTLMESFNSATPGVHTPAWKSGVPRDSGTGWDFEDVRDHYLAKLFAVDPATLRYENNARYLYLSSVVSGEVMARSYDHWRTGGRCSGAIVWFLNDILPGAGWGLIDSEARAKPALEIVRESWQPVALALRDRGMDGMSVVIRNSEKPLFSGRLRVCLYADSRRTVGEAERQISLAVGDSLEVSIDELLGGFSDHLHRHRFGPRRQDTISVRLYDDDGQLVLSRQRGLIDAPLLAADCTVTVSEGSAEDQLVIKSDRALRRVRLSSPGFAFDANYFDLLPDEERVIPVRRLPGGATRGTVVAVNWLGESYFRV